jgi:hypothetical protein
MGTTIPGNLGPGVIVSEGTEVHETSPGGAPARTGLDLATAQPSGPVEVPSGGALSGVSAVDLLAGAKEPIQSYWEPTKKGVPSLVDILSQLKPEDVDAVLQAFSAKLGLPLAGLDQAALAAVHAQPGLIADLFKATPDVLQGLIDLAEKQRAGKGPSPIPTLTSALPNGFAVDQGVGSYPRNYELKPVVGPLLTGDVSNPKLSDDQHNLDATWAEAITRLANNDGSGADNPFTVQFGGQTYKDAYSFFAALRNAGVKLESETVIRSANFADFKIKGENGSIQDVPGGLLIPIPSMKDGGKPITFHALHGTTFFTLQFPDGKTAKLAFFLGIDGEGMRAAGGDSSPEWLGKLAHGPEDPYLIRGRVMKERSGDSAWTALSIAATDTAAMTLAAKDNGLPWGGYGEEGTCLNSTADVEGATDLARGHQVSPMGWPLVGHSQYLINTLTKMATNEALAPEARQNAQRLLDAIEKLPNDTEAETKEQQLDGYRRLAASIPWRSPADAPTTGAAEGMIKVREEIRARECGE